MNEHYNLKDATSALAKLSQERVMNENSGLQLSEVTKDRNWSDKYTVVQSSLWTWHLIHRNDPKKADPDEEVVFNIQGILYKHDLPPFTEDISASSKQLKYLRQSVSLTGLGTDNFELSVQGLKNINAFFSRFAPQDKLQPNTIVDQYGGHTSIECYNRYFTLRKDLPFAKHIPFTEAIDPKGILSRAAGSTYIQTELNLVRYYERVKSLQDDTKYEEIPPVMFRDGDIVEAQVTAMMVPLKGGMFKMMAVLRCLTLLDSTYSRESYVQSTSNLKHLTFPTHRKRLDLIPTLKRKIGYQEEEVASARDKLSRMDLDDSKGADSKESTGD